MTTFLASDHGENRKISRNSCKIVPITLCKKQDNPEGQEISALLFEELPSKLQRVPYARKRFPGAAGSHNDYCSISQDTRQNTLDDIDGLNFGMIHFERIAGNKSGFDNNALIGDGKLTCPVIDERSNE